MALALDPVTLALFGGGVLGAFLRVFMSRQYTWSHRTLIDVFTGGVISVVYTLFPVMPIPANTPPIRLAMLGVLLGMFGSYIVTWALWRAGVFKDDPRAKLPGNGNGEAAK